MLWSPVKRKKQAETSRSAITMRISTNRLRVIRKSSHPIKNPTKSQLGNQTKLGEAVEIISNMKLTIDHSIMEVTAKTIYKGQWQVVEVADTVRNPTVAHLTWTTAEMTPTADRWEQPDLLQATHLSVLELINGNNARTTVEMISCSPRRSNWTIGRNKLWCKRRHLLQHLNNRIPVAQILMSKNMATLNATRIFSWQSYHCCENLMKTVLK